MPREKHFNPLIVKTLLKYLIGQNSDESDSLTTMILSGE